MTDLTPAPAPEWTRGTVDQFYAIRRRLPMLRQQAFDERGVRGWRLVYQGEPVAVWSAGGLTNGVTIRIR